MKDPVVLKIYRGSRLVLVKQSKAEQVIIGRSNEAFVRLDDEQISDLHAVIEQREGAYFVSDLGSETGIKLNGVNTLENQIKSGENLEIGPYSIRFYIGVPKPKSKVDYKKEHAPPEIPGATVKNIKKDESGEVVNSVPQAPAAKGSNQNLENKKTEDVKKQETKNQGFKNNEDTDPSVSLNNSNRDEVTESAEPVHILGDDTDLKDYDNEKLPPSPEPVPEKDKPGVKIQDRDIDEALLSQMNEPVSSGYIAPKSSYSSVDEIIYPYSRGSVLEVIVAWQERVIKTYHFINTQNIFLSNQYGADIYAPLPGPNFRHQLITFGNECVVNIASTMTGELYYGNKTENLVSLEQKSDAIKPSGSGKKLRLEQGQMLKLNLLSDKVSAYIRFVEDAPLATRAPILDFTTTELVGVFMSLASVFVISVYMLLYAPNRLDATKDLLEDRLQKAVITFNPPPVKRIEPPPPPPLEKEETKIEPEKPKVVKVAEKKSQKKQVEQRKTEKPPQPKPPSVAEKVKDKPKEAAPSRNKTENVAGSSRPGGSVNTEKEASSMKTEQKDLSKTGILGVLSSGGASDILDRASSGAGTTIGLADQKTGFQGQASDQSSDGIGTKLQIAGKGGSGSSLAGVGDLNTSGRGGGEGSYGSSGLGGKGAATIIEVAGDDGDFSSTIDKDAIRRLIRKNKNALSGCYERALDVNSRVSGKVVLNWKIISGGKMIEPKVKSSTLGNKEVENCIINRLMVLKFPDPGPNEIAEVDYPFVFKPSN